ncbi:gamma-glutamyl-gamma-aminobutyrate hydrolase family protein [Chitinilyticum litopenaei]|uniref:gamma-glutamyl-gamma-aminobutyrate hydrolase family protein n=1 Tax=Chitinilyticum litopenaei TaxID=1121276 RepID=UPI0003F8FB33|nr:gamma-glutamyl-gamma-aminobutyrate hydrolase family protein [Chitinilyticum litopenaei]
MKIVLLSQRVDCHSELGERRDALDQRLVAWLAEAGYLAVPVPNNELLIDTLWGFCVPHAVVLSGGNDLAVLGGDAPERDAAERRLLARAMSTGIPVFAICRGMQFMVAELGGQLQRVAGHVATRHVLQIDGCRHEVNSYHEWGLLAAPEGFDVLARADDGVIEMVRHRSLPLTGIMWHPERELPFAALDRVVLERALG